MTSLIEREQHHTVTLLRLNRPDKLNAFDNSLIEALMKALDDIELEDLTRVVIITGAGRAFSAGADIAGFKPHLQAGAFAAVAHFMRPGVVSQTK